MKHTKESLLKALKPIPDSALIYVESDHGQTPELGGVCAYTTQKKMPFYGDDIDWMQIENIKNPKKITAVLIG